MKLSHESDWFHKVAAKPIPNVGDEIANEVLNQLRIEIKHGNKITQESVVRTIRYVLKKLNRRLIDEISLKSTDIFSRLRDSIFDDYGIKIAPNTLNNELVREFTGRILSIAQDHLKEFSDKIIDSTVEYMDEEHPEKEDELEDYLGTIVDSVNEEAGTVSRTLLGSLYNEANRRSLEHVKDALGMTEDTALYEWVNPLDYRTTKACRNITKRTKGGVTMKRLTEIVKEESEKEFGGFWKDDNPLYPHWQCRSTFKLLSKD